MVIKITTITIIAIVIMFAVTLPLCVPPEGCDEAGRAEFLREISLMKEMGSHSHVVGMLGCCTLREPYCLLVEHMAKGDLLNYLKNIRRSIAGVSPPSASLALSLSLLVFVAIETRFPAGSP